VAVVAVFDSAPLAALAAITVAFGTTAPYGSLTSHVTVPRSFWRAWPAPMQAKPTMRKRVS